MRNLLLSVGAAALAISAPVMAQGQGNGHGKGKQEQSHKGGGKAKGDKARGQKDHGNAKADRGNARADRGNGRADRKVVANKARGNDRVRTVRVDRDDRDDRVVIRDVRRSGNDRVRAGDRYDDDFRWRYGDAGGRGLVDGCPPGLAKKGNGCLPPGQAKKLWGEQIRPAYADRRLMGPYSNWYRDDDDYRYRMGEDYIYRIGTNGLIAGLIPLYDRQGYYYPVGSQYPAAYDFYNVPTQYRSYYDDPYYRYGDGAIYRVDPKTQLIQSVVALLAGDLSVGQPLPNAYSVYNMPLSYRSTYYDTPNDWYRYNDGYVYRVDPTTMLVTEVIKAII